jgi:hypothetical protein
LTVSGSLTADSIVVTAGGNEIHTAGDWHGITGGNAVLTAANVKANSITLENRGGYGADGGGEVQFIVSDTLTIAGGGGHSY